MLNNLKKNKQGFTIIEVLIVLAIAGLIMLVVFLAVPALQRNARNTQRKSDVSALLGALTEFSANNNGKLPATGTEQTAALGNAKTGYYSNVGVGIGEMSWSATTTVSPLPATAAGDRIVIVVGGKCGALGAVVAGSARQAAIQYQVEQSGTPAPSCQDS